MKKETTGDADLDRMLFGDNSAAEDFAEEPDKFAAGNNVALDMAKAKTAGTTEQQKLFAYAYFQNGGNASKAAIEAGYAAKNAPQTASRLLTYVNVKDLIQKLNDQIKERVIVSKEQIAKELMRVGFTDVRKAYTESGSLKAIKDLDDDIAGAITGVKVMEEFAGHGDNREKIGETVEVKFNPKIPALAELNKMFGYYAPALQAQTDKDGKDIIGIMKVQIVPPVPLDED